MYHAPPPLTTIITAYVTHEQFRRWAFLFPTISILVSTLPHNSLYQCVVVSGIISHDHGIISHDHETGCAKLL